MLLILNSQKNIKKKHDISYYARYWLNEKLELYNIGNIIKLALKTCPSNFYYQISITGHNFVIFLNVENSNTKSIKSTGNIM